MLNQHQHPLSFNVIMVIQTQRRRVFCHSTALCSTPSLQLSQAVTPVLYLLFGYNFKECPEQFKSPDFIPQPEYRRELF